MKQQKGLWWKVMIVFIGLGAGIASAWYTCSVWDIVPDKLGPAGYLDDLVILIIIVYLTSKLIKRIVGRYSSHKQQVQAWGKTHNLWKMMHTLKFWLWLILISVTLAYWFWPLDIIADHTPVVGLVDDVVITLGVWWEGIKLLKGIGGRNYGY